MHVLYVLKNRLGCQMKGVCMRAALTAEGPCYHRVLTLELERGFLSAVQGQADITNKMFLHRGKFSVGLLLLSQHLSGYTHYFFNLYCKNLNLDKRVFQKNLD